MPDTETTTVKRNAIDTTKLEAVNLNSTDSASADSIVFVNTYVGKYCVAVTKAWDDENDCDGVRPDKINVELHKFYHYIDPETGEIKDARAKVEKISKSSPAATENDLDYVELSEANNWTAVVKGVDKYDSLGYEIIYGWAEAGMVFFTPSS